MKNDIHLLKVTIIYTQLIYRHLFLIILNHINHLFQILNEEFFHPLNII